VSDEHGHTNHHGDADDDDHDKESAHRLSSNGAARSLRLPDRFYISGSLMDARQYHHDEDALTLPLAHRGHYHPFFAGRTTKCSRCGGPALPQTGESPAWGKRGFLGEARIGGIDLPHKYVCRRRQRFKATTPPERSMFARRRCRRTGYAIPQYQYVAAVRKRFNGPKGLRGGDENSRATCCGEKARLQALKKICSQALRSSSNSCSACL
jgi:hypothetical protein